jgi:hypothetical protein
MVFVAEISFACLEVGRSSGMGHGAESSGTATGLLAAGLDWEFDLRVGEGSAGVLVVVGGSTTSLGVGTAVSCDAELGSFRDGPPPLPPRPLPRPPLFPRLPSRVDVLR